MTLKSTWLLVSLACAGAVMAQPMIDEKIPSKLQSHYIFDHAPESEGSVGIRGFKAYERMDEQNQRWTGLDYTLGIQDLGSLSVEAHNIEKQAGRAVLKANFAVKVNREELQPDGSMRKVTLEHVGNGSAIVVGKKYVLTNFHVLDVLKKDKQPSECPGGWLTSGEDPELKVQCKSIIACGEPVQKIVKPLATDPTKTETYFIDNYDDWCLIEVTPTPSGRDIGDEVEPLKLSRNASSGQNIQKVATIGNPGGKGIQASWGTHKAAANARPKVLNTNAFALSGNSGGALINSRGKLMGLVYSSNYHDVESAAALSTDHLLNNMSGKVPEEILAEIQEDADLLSDEKTKCSSLADQEGALREPHKLSRWFKKAKNFIKKKVVR